MTAAIWNRCDLQSGRYTFLDIGIVRCDWLRSNQNKVNLAESYWRWVEVKQIFDCGLLLGIAVLWLSNQKLIQIFIWIIIIIIKIIIITIIVNIDINNNNFFFFFFFFFELNYYYYDIIGDELLPNFGAKFQR